ncbi:MAG: hypothetical protein JXX29_13155 [Deltaproteobacteria bacterium]|nr:hypothetical protein [Deltaproteobacteria bacterium]MBN2672626.1 hypothetical protein [Deltaproteobacteria bacterium]
MSDKNLALLVEELKKNGVDKGNEEAKKIIEAAEKDAASIRAKAKSDGEKTVAKANDEAESIKRMAASSAKQTGVSLIASLKQSVNELVGNALGAIVKNAMENDELVEKMLVAFAQNLSPNTKATVTVSDSIDVEKLSKAVFSKVSSDLAQGITIQCAPGFPGIRVQKDGESVKYELTENLIKEMIAPFLSERTESMLFPK